MAPPRERPLVVYHGECGFCRRWVERLRRWDRHDRLDYLALQDPAAAAATSRPRTELERAAHVVLPSGEVLNGAAGFRALCGYLPGGRMPAAVLGVPGVLSVAERLYQWIARRWGPVGSNAEAR
jgi:predicted DCC family thiol-disulfide oxidoreductase YuxK